MTIQATFAATVVDEWARAGVTDAVVAPGGRSTPFALALAADQRLRVHVVLDERSAGFFALGIGLATGRPAIVLTTSGTAAVELHPAVVEACHARVPLLAVTADRPTDLHDVGAPQTVEQHEVFGAAVRWHAAIDPVAWPETSWRSVGARAFIESTTCAVGPGPVHLNVAFRDPLLGEPAPLPPGRQAGRAWHVAPAARPTAARSPIDLSARRGLVVAGGGADPRAVQAFAAALEWPVLADPRSGCQGRPGQRQCIRRALTRRVLRDRAKAGCRGSGRNPAGVESAGAMVGVARRIGGARGSRPTRRVVRSRSQRDVSHALVADDPGRRGRARGLARRVVRGGCCRTVGPRRCFPVMDGRPTRRLRASTDDGCGVRHGGCRCVVDANSRYRVVRPAARGHRGARQPQANGIDGVVHSPRGGGGRRRLLSHSSVIRPSSTTAARSSARRVANSTARS